MRKIDLTVPVLPFSKIDEMGASMYKGVSYKRDNACLVQQQNGVIPDNDGGATPTDTLQKKEHKCQQEDQQL